jgi:hypothetical protein
VSAAKQGGRGSGLTAEMCRILDILDLEGAAIAGTRIEGGCRKRDISAATLRALAARRLVTLGLSPDGGLMARLSKSGGPDAPTEEHCRCGEAGCLDWRRGSAGHATPTPKGAQES